MAKAKRIRGRNFMMFLDDEVICLSTGCDLTISANYTETATKDDGIWNGRELSGISYSGSNDSLMAENANDTALAHDMLFEKMIAGASVVIMFGIPSNQNDEGVPDGGWTAPTTKYYKGSVKITSIAFSAPVDGDMTLNVSFDSDGSLSYVGA